MRASTLAVSTRPCFSPRNFNKTGPGDEARYIYACDHGWACDNLLQNVPPKYCTVQAQAISCITPIAAMAITTLFGRKVIVLQTLISLMTTFTSVRSEPLPHGAQAEGRRYVGLCFNTCMHVHVHAKLILPVTHAVFPPYITFLHVESPFNPVVHPARYPPAPWSKCQHRRLTQSSLPAP